MAVPIARPTKPARHRPAPVSTGAQSSAAAPTSVAARAPKSLMGMVSLLKMSEFRTNTSKARIPATQLRLSLPTMPAVAIAASPTNPNVRTRPSSNSGASGAITVSGRNTKGRYGMWL